jgi:hypothetical protein
MGLFNKNTGLMDVIRCDEESYLIWKWHPKGSETNTTNRENSIRWGSSLRVKDGEVAVFVYKQKDGTVQDYIVGPFDQSINTSNLPILTSLLGLAYAGNSPFQAEIYFINLAQIIQNKFAVPFFDVYDPRFADFGVPVSVRGNLNFKITDYKNFIKLHRLIDFNVDDFQNQIKDAVSRYVKNTVVTLPVKENIPLVQIESKITDINESLENDLKLRLKENFGVDVTSVDVSTIEIDKTSEGYKELMQVTKNITSQTIQAETEAKLKNIADKQRIEIENYEENLRINREEGQYAVHKQTQTENMAAFQVEKQAEVGIAGAEALGHMGENGAGNVNLGGSSNGFNPAAMMASMAVGNVVGQNIAGSMSGIMNSSQNNVNATKVDPYEEVKKLKTLLDEGIITEEEFNQKKKELLGL